MKTSIRKIIVFTATVALVGCLTNRPLAAHSWIGPDLGDWFVASSWADGTQPNPSHSAKIQNGTSVVFNTAATTEIEKLRIGANSNTGDGTLLMEAGTLQINLFDDDAIKLGSSPGQTGSIEQTGGIIQVLNGGAVIGQGTTGGPRLGSYTISGGSLLVQGTNQSPFDTGQITVGESNGFGIFTVVGTGPTEISSVDRFDVKSNGTLRMILDASGVTPILSAMSGNVSDGPKFRSADDDGPGSILDIDFSALTTTIGDILLVNNRSADTVDGTLGSDEAFENAPEGTILHTFGDGSAYQVSYAFTAPDGMGEANDLALLAIAAPNLPGDFDIDGDVDGADFLKWQRDGLSGLSASELDSWETNFGNPTDSQVALSAVPEPTSLGLLIMGSIAGLIRRRNSIGYRSRQKKQ